jgi:predicted ABC-type ATPase
MTNIKPVLIIIAGPNGSGKTTITTQILKHEWLSDCIYINPDNIAKEKFGDWNAAESVINAANYAAKLRNDCLRNGTSLIFETVFSSIEKLDFLQKAKDEGYFTRLFFISTSHPSINAARITNRVLEGGHDVPITKIISRYSKSIINCAAAAKYTDRLYVYDNSVDFAPAKLLFRAANGELTKRYDVIPDWAQMIFEATKHNS